MVDPRIYRAGLALVAAAVIVFGFSLQGQPSPAQTTIATTGFSGSAAAADMAHIAKTYPNRPPGSVGDGVVAGPETTGVAGYIVSELNKIGGFAVSTSSFQARTANGERTLLDVTATRTGLTAGTIVLVAHRDASGRQAEADASGAAVLLQLAHALAGETENHSIELVWTSGQVGAAGAAHLAQSLSSQPIDGVIVLGDLAGAHASEPIVGTASDAAVFAPPLLRRTLASYVTADSGLQTGGSNIGGQFAHLAFPLTTTEQGPFGRHSIPAVLVSLSGDRAPAPDEPIDTARLAQLGGAVLQTVNALDSGPEVPAPSAYLTLSGQLVPGWAIRLLVFALILPVAMATVDALARARRRGHTIRRWLLWVLAGAVPFALGLAALELVRVAQLLPATPPGPVAGGVGIGGAGAAVLVAVALVIVAAFVLLRPVCVRLASEMGSGARQPQSPAGDAAGVGLMVVACLVTLAIWAVNPFAAGLAVPALHLWLWLAQPGVRARRGLTIALAVLALAPPLLVAVYYAHSFGLSPLGLVWTGVLAVVGGQLTIAAGIGWCVLLGCAASALVIAVRAATTAPVAAAPVTVRGPVTYAGPGSLGGTDSALGGRR
jgi:hypothetical protein